MFVKVLLISFLVSCACAEYLYGHSNYNGSPYSNHLTNRQHGYGNFNRYPYGEYNNYYGGAISYTNTNLESYGGNAYHKLGAYNNGGYYNGNDKYAYPRYSFNYDVNDPVTGDQKEQHETRDGDVVRGHYALKEADGTTRRVEYESNDRNGFNAVVSRYGVAHHPTDYNYPYNKY